MADAAGWTMRLEGISAHVLKRFNRNNITTITKKGYDNINPADMLKEIYESRSINIFNTIIDRIADCIIIPIYSF